MKHLIALAVVVLLWNPVRAEEGIPLRPSGRPIETMRLVVEDTKLDKTFLDQKVQFTGRDAAWKPDQSVALPYAKLRKIRLELPARSDDEMRVSIDFMMTGKEKKERLVLVDLKAFDDKDRLLFHNWEMQSDQRSFAREFNEKKPRPLGGFVSSLNNASLRLPDKIVPRIHTFLIELRMMSPEELRHYPRQPQKLDLTISRPTKEGKFEISCIQPPRLNIFDPNLHGLVANLLVRDNQGKLQKTVLKQHDGKISNGRFCFAFQLEPEQIEHGSIVLTFYTLQQTGWKIEDFYAGKAKGGYSGIWTGDGGKLSELPFEDSPRGRRQTALKK